MSYDNTDRGALFKNRDKESEKHPDYRGSINVGGEDFWISAWLKESKKGDKYMSLSVQSKESGSRQIQKSKTETFYQAQDDFDDDLPF